MENKIVITNETVQGKEYLVTALLEGGRLAEVSCEKAGEMPLLGSVYVAKIKRIAKGAGAVFAELTPGQMAYLPLQDIKEPLMARQCRPGTLTEGDEIVVQVVKEGVQAKEPTISANITITGRSFIFSLEKNLFGVSKKLGKKDREYLKGLFLEKKEDWYGLILRTSAASTPKEQLFLEFEELSAKFSAIIRQYRYRTCYSCLYRAPAGYISSVRNCLPLHLDRIITDDPGVYEALLQEFGESVSFMGGQIVLYGDPALSLSALYGLKGKLKNALQNRVWLKSGGYLVIEPTEALTVIDVNSGKCIKGERQRFYFSVNLEAAEEIARQLRLRNISGICIVDFINMDSQEERNELVRALKGYLAKDTVPAAFVDFTELGLVEITRKKVKKPLWEQVKSHISGQ